MAAPLPPSRTYECRCVLPLLGSHAELVRGDMRAPGEGPLLRLSNSDTVLVFFGQSAREVQDWAAATATAIRSAAPVTSEVAASPSPPHTAPLPSSHCTPPLLTLHPSPPRSMQGNTGSFCHTHELSEAVPVGTAAP